MNQISGTSLLNLQTGFHMQKAIFLLGTVMGTVATANTVTVHSVILNGITLSVLNETIIGQNYANLNLQYAKFILLPTAVVRQSLTLTTSATPDAQLINNGIWTVNGSTVFLTGSVEGTGPLIVNNGGLSYSWNSNVTGPIILNGARLSSTYSGATYIFNTISGDASSILYLQGYFISIKNVTCESFSDGTGGTLNLDNFSIKTYTAYGSATRNFGQGTIDTVTFSTGNFPINLGGNVRVNSISITDGNRLNSAPATNIINLTFNGGTIAQTGGNGIFRVANTTYFALYYNKFIETNTVLQTRILDCTRCTNPDCGLRIADWNHIVAEQTFGCII